MLVICEGFCIGEIRPAPSNPLSKPMKKKKNQEIKKNLTEKKFHYRFNEYENVEQKKNAVLSLF